MMFGPPSGSLPSPNTHAFSQIPQANIPRSQFDRSHAYKTTFNAGYLVPVYADEVLPGDTFNLRMTTFARLATPQTPFMDNMYCDSFFFFVPNRLLWDNWQKFNGEQTDPGDDTDFEVPVTTAMSGAGTGYNAWGQLYDYLGVPPGVAGLQPANLHARAYNLIYNEWFRDQNLQDSLIVDKDDGPDNPAHYVLVRRGKRHDYFTSCLPWPQKGPAVELPIGGFAPIVDDVAPGNLDVSVPRFNVELRTGNNGGGATRQAETVSTGGSTASPMFTTTIDETTNLYLNAPAQTATMASTEITDNFQADLSSATAATINAIRQAFQVQRMYERDARGGTRYTEIIRAHFGVISPDARLQRPEYLGGGSAYVNMSPIPQTNATGATGTPQGNLAAMGTFSHRGAGFVKSFTEHGVILGLVSVRADMTYQSGLNRMFSRSTRFDFYWPALSHLGEQAVLNKEIFAQGTGGGTDDDDVFGYQERYAEYRYKPSLITGEFRSSFTDSLDVWHLAQDFGSLPALDETFIVETPPVDRVIAVSEQSGPQFLFDAHFALKCARPMPVYSVPGMIDQF